MLRVFVIVLVFVGAIFVLVSKQPEKILTRSIDGVISISGVSRTVRSATVEQFSDFKNPFVKPISSYYLITPKPGNTSFSSDITVLVLEQWKLENPDVTKLYIYRYSPKINFWLEIPTIVDLSENTLLANMDILEPTWIVVGER